MFKLKRLPNILSVFRIVLVPAFLICYFTDESEVKIAAITIYAVAALSDFLDGFIARRLKNITSLGLVLDPLGDKMMLVAALIAITVDEVIPVWAVSVAVLKEALMGIGGLIIHNRKIAIPPSNILGKVSTVVFIAACLALMLFPRLPQSYRTAIVFAAVLVMFMALGSYILVYIGVIKKNAKTQNELSEK